MAAEGRSDHLKTTHENIISNVIYWQNLPTIIVQISDSILRMLNNDTLMVKLHVLTLLVLHYMRDFGCQNYSWSLSKLKCGDLFILKEWRSSAGRPYEVSLSCRVLIDASISSLFHQPSSYSLTSVPFWSCSICGYLYILEIHVVLIPRLHESPPKIRAWEVQVFLRFEWGGAWAQFVAARGNAHTLPVELFDTNI